jgi:hypothetical protein
VSSWTNLLVSFKKSETKFVTYSQRFDNQKVSLRQAAEWGMRALQGTFCRLKSRLMSDVDVRHDTILSCILLHNFRTHEVGLNQIATVFNPEYEQFIIIEGYDRISNYF